MKIKNGLRGKYFPGRMMIYRAIISILASLLVSTANAQIGAGNGEWLFYGGDGGSTKYSALEQINRDNVGDLRIAWRWKTQNFGSRPEFYYQATPLMIDGVLYTTAGNRRSVVAIDAETGETLWVYRMDEGERWQNAARRNSGRGVAYWTDGEDKRIVLVTPGFHLVALDANTGIPKQDFGNEGFVDLKEGLNWEPARGEAPIGSSSPAIISHDVIVVGPALRGGSMPESMNNVPGDIRGYDVRTGRRLWTFHTIPQEGEFGIESWEEDSWQYTGNAGAWAPLSVDDELGYVYLPVETPTGDYYGGHRGGDNLFGDSLVCLDIRTGERIWHYQLSHHEIWDYDPPAAPILLDVNVSGRNIKAVAQLTKQAFAFVFDRVTGEPVWPIEERPVPQSDVPGERTSPTQPFPTKPAPFDLQGISIDDLIDFTPELREEAIRIVSQHRIGPLFTPPSLVRNPDGTNGTIQLPGSGGGADWDSGAADPETGVLYVSSVTRPILVSLDQRSESSDMELVKVSESEIPGPQGLPLTRPPWGRITAIDLNTGDHLWMTPNGETPESVKNHPDLQGMDLSQTGDKVRGGLLVTKTLLFAGANLRLYGEPVLQGYDKTTGERLVKIDLPAVPTGVPMTYMLNGKQYIVVPVGAPNHPGELVALRLP